MILPDEQSGWTNAKYQLSGFYFAVSDEAFHEMMRGMKYEITNKEPVRLQGFDGFWYTFHAEERGIGM